MRNEKQRLYASVLRSTGRRKLKKAEKNEQIAQARTTLMPPKYVSAFLSDRSTHNLAMPVLRVA
jgi:hypothetical protein